MAHRLNTTGTAVDLSAGVGSGRASPRPWDWSSGRGSWACPPWGAVRRSPALGTARAPGPTPWRSTTPLPSFTTPPVIVDLSAVDHSPALPVVMTCVATWLQAALTNDSDVRRMVVVDESWRIFSHLPIVAWMQQPFKLSRTSGTMNVLVMHRLSDLASAGAAGSHQVRLAEGLLARPVT